MFRVKPIRKVNSPVCSKRVKTHVSLFLNRIFFQWTLWCMHNYPWDILSTSSGNPLDNNHQHPWTFMNILEHSCTFMNIHEHPLIFTNIHEHSWTFMNILEQSWIFMNINRHPGTSMNIHKHRWTFLNILEHSWTFLNIH